MAVDFNIEIRKKQLESLDQFVSCSRDKVQSILNSLGWSVDKIQEEQRLFVKCPYDSHHKIPAEKIDDHTDKCEAKSAGYDLHDNFTSEPNRIQEKNSIKIDTNKKIEILCQAVQQIPYFRTAWNGKDPDPRTYSRLVSTFSSDERLVLYNYSVANTEGPPEIPEFDTSLTLKENGDSSFSKEALMSFERDIKRRSVKYKPVHTNHKNYKEVLRDVIDSQMQQYNEWLKRIKRSKESHTPVFFPSEDTEEFDNQNKCQEYVDRPHSSISKFSNHSSSSHGKRHERSSKNSHFDGQSQSGDDVKKHHYKEHHSNYSTHFSKSRYKYTDRDEDSQESNSLSKISPTDFDSSSENYDNTSRGHSRDSSVHSSYKYKEKSDRFRENRRHNSDGREWRKRDYSSGSSKHDSRHRRYTEDRSHRTHSKEKSRRHRHSTKET